MTNWDRLLKNLISKLGGIMDIQILWIKTGLDTIEKSYNECLVKGKKKKAKRLKKRINKVQDALFGND